MASSSMTDVAQAQIPLSCQFCETSHDIKWNCLDCSLLLCDTCKQRLHSKVKSARQHRIDSIRNVGVTKQTDESQPITQIPCRQHSQHMCCLFCKSCEKPICPSCLLGIHKEHHWEELGNAGEDIKSDDHLNRYSWYFGEIDRWMGTQKLRTFNQNGTYLLRKSMNGGPKQPFTLMVVYNDHIYNLKVRIVDNDRVALGDERSDEETFKSVEELIQYHKNCEVRLKKKDDGSVNVTLLINSPPK